MVWEDIVLVPFVNEFENNKEFLSMYEITKTDESTNFKPGLRQEAKCFHEGFKIRCVMEG